MDAKDVRIFCEMAFTDWIYGSWASRRPGSSAISKKLGLDEKTVRLRVKKMEESGFIKYYQVIPNLALFGMKFQGLCRFEAMNIPTKFGVLGFIHELPGIVEAFDYLGPAVALSIAGKSEEDVQATAKQVAARFELTMTSLGNHTLREPRRQLDSLDWSIIVRMRYGARVSTKEIAQALSVTPRVVEYRTRKLMDEDVFQIRPVLNTQRQEGLVFYELGVSMDLSKQISVKRRIEEKYGNRMWSMRVAPNGTLLAEMFGFSLADPEEVLVELLSTEGVKWCSMSVLKEIIEPKRPNWIDRLIQEKIA
ncbi:MAG: Lrp/AsnC family transcriptional regulator [Thaumarchaeota archaeon]|nr:Lrp/AsnC family transcriptional regulator [Nitrososphaerota archaeon]